MLSVLLAVHIIAGAVTLVAMWVPIVSVKGSRVHVLGGRVFFVGMSTVALSAMFVALVRLLADERVEASLFLAFVALQSGLGALHGRHVLSRRRGERGASGAVVQMMMVVLAVTSSFMAAWGVWELDVLRCIFGGLGLALALPAVKLLVRDDVPSEAWLLEHLRAMGFAAIGAVTAFVVVNWSHAPQAWVHAVPGWLVWTAPGVIGGVWITVASRRLRGA